MNYYQASNSSARSIRAKATFYTLIFHLALLAYIFYGADADLLSYLPETLKEWAGLAETVEEAPRP